MIQLDEPTIDAAAPNGDAIKNARGLLQKGKLVRLNQDAEGTLLFGECKGSGKENYQVSCDFIRPDQPTYRCTCPSRQFPCKHCLGLMYAFAQGRPFAVAEVPADVAQKREKLGARVEKQKERAAKPAQVNTAALRKKVEGQLEALDLLEALLHDLTRAGLANLNAKSARRIEEHAKQLGAAHVSGAQVALQELTRLFHRRGDTEEGELPPAQRERVYSEALDRLNRLHALARRGREALQQKLEDPALKPDAQSGIEAWLGYAWKLAELREAGLIEEDAELLQLAFHSHDDRAREELVDTGIWLNLRSGQVQKTRTYRPYQALKFIKAEDSVYHVVQVKELCIYPGEGNPRVRWDAMTPRPPTAADYARVLAAAQGELEPLLKTVRAQLKTPLAERTPLALIRYRRLGQVPGEGGPQYVLEDAKGQRIVLADDDGFDEPDTCHLLPLVPRRYLASGALLGRFHHDLDHHLLRLKPLTLVGADEALRLSY